MENNLLCNIHMSVNVLYFTIHLLVLLSPVNMMQDVAQKQGNINVDVVTKALAESLL